MPTRRALHVVLAAGFLVFLLAASQVSYADSHARIVRLSDVEGSVHIDRNTGQGFEKAIMNMPVKQGTRVETGSSGRAEVEFENGTVLRLSQNSSVEFTNLSLRPDGERSTDVRVNDGTVYVNYKHKGGDDLRLDAGEKTITIDRDAQFRLRMNGGQAELAVFKGEVGLPENGEVAKVKKNETFNFDISNGSQVLLAKNIAPLPDDDWNAQRNDYNTQYSAHYNHSQYPYMYGYSDLNYYGSFFNAPGYGTLWRPFGASTAWDPFGAGAWAYDPSYGYMWVSGYPWGWTPYRYGSWVYVGGYGWAWQPGGWNTWNAYPVVVNAPSTWQRPMPPPTTGVHSTVLVGNPAITTPIRPARGVATSVPSRGVPGEFGSSTSVATGIGRPSRTQPTGSSSAAAANASPSTARPVRSSNSQPSQHSAPVQRPSRSSAPPTRTSSPVSAPAASPRMAPAPAPAPIRPKR